MHDAVYLSTPTSTTESMDTEIATLKSEVIKMGSNLHTQGIVSRNLDYGYWSIDWNGLYENQGAVVYEWCVSHQVLHSSQLNHTATAAHLCLCSSTLPTLQY